LRYVRVELFAISPAFLPRFIVLFILRIAAPDREASAFRALLLHRLTKREMRVSLIESDGHDCARLRHRHEVVKHRQIKTDSCAVIEPRHEGIHAWHFC
jgi:hypothetical protein